MSFGQKKWGVFKLLNQTPHEGCLLVFNAMQKDWRTKASGFKRRYGFAFKLHAITGASRTQAHTATHNSDLYVTLKE